MPRTSFLALVASLFLLCGQDYNIAAAPGPTLLWEETFESAYGSDCNVGGTTPVCADVTKCDCDAASHGGPKLGNHSLQITNSGANTSVSFDNRWTNTGGKTLIRICMWNAETTGESFLWETKNGAAVSQAKLSMEMTNARYRTVCNAGPPPSAYIAFNTYVRSQWNEQLVELDHNAQTLRIFTPSAGGWLLRNTLTGCTNGFTNNGIRMSTVIAANTTYYDNIAVWNGTGRGLPPTGACQ